MTPEQEDALVQRAVSGICNFHGEAWHDSIRLAIRAAVAAERERCARVCEEMYEKWDASCSPVIGDPPDASMCAAAIRRGTE